MEKFAEDIRVKIAFWQFKESLWIQSALAQDNHTHLNHFMSRELNAQRSHYE
jgi:hypothetical protein